MREPLTLTLIRPLLAQTRREGGELVCTFLCPATGVQVVASAKLRARRWRGVEVAAQRGLERGVLGAIVRQLGESRLGRVAQTIARDVVRHGASRVPRAPSSQGAVEAATLDAFRSVADQFCWSDAHQSYVIASAMR